MANELAAPIRLLMVEDNEYAASAIGLALTESGFDVCIVHSGREAVGSLLKYRSDVILLDLTLPDVDGALVAEMVRQDWPDLPIILTSGHEVPPRVRRLLLDRRTVFLQKPYELSLLIAAISSLRR